MLLAIIGPDGSEMASMRAPEELTITTLDRESAEFHIAVNLARPWRADANQADIYANQADIYRSRRVHDPRSEDRTVS